MIMCANDDDCRHFQALERRADKQIARQEGALVRAVVRVWKAHERGQLLERVQHARVLRQAWEIWKRRLRHQGDLEGSHTSPSVIFTLIPCIQLLHSPLLSDPKSMSLLPHLEFGRGASPRNKAHRHSQCNTPMRNCSSAFSSNGVYSYART